MDRHHVDEQKYEGKKILTIYDTRTKQMYLYKCKQMPLSIKNVKWKEICVNANKSKVW